MTSSRIRLHCRLRPCVRQFCASYTAAGAQVWWWWWYLTEDGVTYVDGTGGRGGGGGGDGGAGVRGWLAGCTTEGHRPTSPATHTHASSTTCGYETSRPGQRRRENASCARVVSRDAGAPPVFEAGAQRWPSALTPLHQNKTA